MRCTQCQAENPPGAKFCSDCGARLEVACPGCGHANALGSRFCNECGRALHPPAPDARPAVPPPQARIPRHLAEKILNSRAILEGERKQVTVLFADMKGSMELLAERDPEEARQLIDPVLERMMDAVHRYEGTVNQVLGDGVMALFGAPVAHEDHAVRACYAALAMQESIRRYTAEMRRTHGIEIQIRVGLNSGDVVVRAIGNDLHMDYSAVGQTTHLAARMEQLASPGTTRLTGATLRLAEGFVQVTPIGPVPVKGVAGPVEVFELAGAGTSRTRLQTAAARGLTRFVGRGGEVEQLRLALRKASAGHGQIVAVIGEPGVGKSRLVWELIHSQWTQGWLVLESSSVSYGKAAAYLPVVDLLKSYFQINARDDGRHVREKVMGKVLALDEALRPILPGILALLEGLVTDPAAPPIDASRRRRDMTEAVKQLLLRESRVQPVCMVFEDLHWVDPQTQDFLDALVESLPAARLLLLVNYRPEYSHGWGSKTYYTQLRLEPLPPGSAEALLDDLLGRDPGLAPAKQLLIARTDGNPFFLEEAVRMLVEVGVLTGGRGAHRLAKTPDAIHVPTTVQAVLGARIDRLPPEGKSLLQAAAAIGKDIPFALLRAVAEQSEDELRLGLARLQAAELLYETAFFPDLEHTFKHTLTQDVAYGSLLHDRRRALHARIVEAFETLYPERVTERIGWLTHHAFRGELWSRAVRYLGHAVDQPSLDGYGGLTGRESPGHLWWAGDYEHASRLAQQDLRTAAGVVGGFAYVSFHLTVVTHLRLGQIHHSLGDYPRAVDFLRQNLGALDGEMLYEALTMAGLPSVLSRTWLGMCLAEQGNFAEGIARGQEAVHIARAADHAYSLVVGCFGLGGVYLLKGDLHPAISILEQGIARKGTKRLERLRPFVASLLGTAYARSERVGEALPLLQLAVNEAVSMELMANHSTRVAGLAEAHLLGGDPDRARLLAGQALDLAREHTEQGHEAHAYRLLGEIASRGEPPDLEAAEANYRRALDLGNQLGMRPLQARCHLGLGGTHRMAGRRDEARAELTVATNLFRAMDMTFWLARAESMAALE